MTEYEIRGEIINYVEEKINNGINEYHKLFSENIEQLVLYPLVSLEISYDSSVPESISNYVKRYTTSWIIGKNLSLLEGKALTYGLNQNGLKYYNDSIYPVIASIMQDYRTLIEIKDGNSFAKSKVIQDGLCSYRLVTSLVSDKYRKEDYYFHGLYNPEKFRIEQDMVINGLDKLIRKYLPKSKKDLNKLKRLHIDIDWEMLDYSERIVAKDIDKLGKRTRSSVICGIEDTKKIIAFLHYLATSKRIRNRLFKICMGDNAVGLSDYLIRVDKEWLINKINRIYSIGISKITKLIDYLTFKGDGSLVEFPLIDVSGEIVTIPALIQLNDFHFNLVSGHYIKNIQFIDSEKTIAKTISDMIEEKVNNYTNIISVREKYYECFDDGNKINSDIDFMMYDELSNCLLVIECKWKFNHYSNELDEKYVKIQDTLSKIFTQQISKHKVFLEECSNLHQLLKEKKQDIKLETDPYIFYLAVDKRNQLHLGDRHLITVYMLLFFMDNFSNGNTLHLDKLITEIEGLKTTVEYFNCAEEKKYKISNDIYLISDDLSLSYYD